MRELIIEKFEQPYEVNFLGEIIWRNKYGQIHRDNDLPAKIYTNGDKEWMKNGVWHRGNDKPAGIYTDQICWVENYERHRSNGKPAVIYYDGRKEWWIHDNLIKKNY